MMASIKFQDPSDQAVEVTLRGALHEFEALRGHLSADKPVPHYAVQALLQQIDDAVRRLRGRVDAQSSKLETTDV